ncbi:DUF3592 domain-containing protein [Pedobacter sp. WC2423]|uniref:DUF3592 domain-containing protein n=1 Tax=Pedobacter sp. WC2423 TaxID=3234142 RepID=UPI0034673AFD
MVYLLIVGLLLSGFGLFKVIDRKRFKKFGVKTSGVVSDLVLSGRSYYPIVSYETLDGVSVEEEYSLGSMPSAYRKGESVKVIYKEGDCKKFILDNKSSEYIEFGFMVAGLIMMFISCYYSYSRDGNWNF